MSEPSVSLSHISFNKIYRVLASVGLALVLIPALLFTFSSRTLAAPSDTAISQRIQNTVTSGTTITGTYGEILTATMRFTVTAGTMLTGPITITTRFNGYTPANQLGFRYLSQQGAITAALGTPVLTTNFTYTVGSTTLLTWTFDTIDNTSGGSYVYEIPYQVDLVWDGTADVATSASIPNVASNTKIVWSPGGVGNTTTANALTVNRLKPDLSFSTKTARTSPTVQGGATVVYTVTLKNGNNPANFSTAYDLLVTDTLDSRLTYVGASPAPDSVSGHVLAWTTPNWSLAPNTTWVAYVTATLPVTIPANTNYTNTVATTHSTLFGVVSDEGYFTSTTAALVSGGLAGSKQGSPTANIRIGDSVTYTVLMTVAQNAYLVAPVFTDTLPAGLHYQSGSFGFTAPGGATLSGTMPITAVSGANELLIWKLHDIPAGTAQAFTASYVANVTGLDANGALVYTALGTNSVLNSVIGGWQDNSGSRLSLSAVNISVQLAQPNLNNATFGVSVSGWVGTPIYEVGSTPVYNFSLANTGIVTAYEAVISFQLPSGVSYQGSLNYPGTLQVISEPAVDATGILQFVVKEIPKSSGTINFTFNTLIEDTATPGDLLTAQVAVLDYSSQPGGQYDGVGSDTDNTGAIDRHYGTIAAGLPATKNYSFTLRGLTAIKISNPTSVQPGQLLTYSILYSNTSAVYTSTNVQIVDTYDSLLTYLSSTSSPNAGSVMTGANTLTWNVGTLNPNPSASSRITATFQVATGVDRSVRMLTNTITSNSDSAAPAMSRIVTTTLVQPKPTITLDDKNITVTANSLMTYTMIYTNAPASTGATTGTFTVTLNYASYLSFTLATGRTPVPGSNGTIFTDTLGPGISRTVQLQLRVARPLPYDLTIFTSTATIVNLAVDISDSESENTPVALPVFNLVKVNTSPGNPPVGPGDPIGYRIYVTNTGTVTGTNIVITDVWDTNTYNQNASGNWNIQSTKAVYTTILTLTPGAGVTLDPLNMNISTTLLPNVQLIHNDVQLTSRETTQQVTGYDTPMNGLFIQKTHTPDPVFPNEVLTYTIAYTALGSAIVSPVITDTLPAGVVYENCFVDVSGNCSGDSSQVVWHWPSGLLQNDSGTITVVVQAPATEWITLTNNYVSSGSNAPYREGPPDYVYVGRPHLSLTKKAATAVTPIAPGDYITYTLTYTNSGSYKSTGTLVTDTLPSATTFQSCAGASCIQAGGVVSWTVGEVPITTTGLLTLVVRVNPNAGNTVIANTVYRISADRGVVGEVAPTSVNITVVRPALAVTKSVSPSWISLTGSVTYTVRYTNTGGGTFTQLYFTDTLDVRTSFQSASSNCAFSSGRVVCTDSNLVPNQSHQFTLTVGNTSLSNGDVVTNAVLYLAANQTEVLPVTTTNTVEVPASNAGAAADFVGVPTSGAFPLNVTFTNQSSGNISGANYLWDFGDGNTNPSGAFTVSHTYNLAGVYTVSLTINTTLPGSHTRIRKSYITASGAIALGVSLTTTNSAKSSLASQVVTYSLNLKNTANVPDSFTLAASGNSWSTIVAPSVVGPLAAGASTTVVVSVTVPAVSHNSQDFATIAATSATSASVQSSVMLTTTAYDPAQGLYLTPATTTKSGSPSQVVTYTLTITNNGRAADSFTLALSSHSWTTVSSTYSVGPLNYNASASIVVSVTVPASPSPNPNDVVTLTATSALFPTASRTSVLTTQGLFNVGSSLTTTNAAKSGLASQAVTYTLNLQNTGNAPDSFNLARSNSGWSTLIAPTAVGPLGAGGSATIVVTVTVPLTASLHMSDVATIKATSVTSPSVQSSVVLTTQLQSFDIYLPLVLKNF